MSADDIAAIDLGSNSFHMIVARLTDGQLQVVDRLREMVQLGHGLDRRLMLSEEAQQRALQCLSRFAQRLRDLPAARVRIAGTNTMRRAKNGPDFMRRAQDTLGHEVEIISGMEEARLIYLGVSHSMAGVPGRRLVIDIGGGSTELIIGERFEPIHLESLEMGCVSMTRRAFAKGKVKEADLRVADLLVRVEMEPVEVAYRELGWNNVTGASGTIKAIRDVVVAEGWCSDGITLDAMRQLRGLLPGLGNAEAIAKRWGLSPERASVFTGGFTVLYGVVESLNIERVDVSDCAMREGLIYDLVGRIRHEDVRDRTIGVLTARFGLDADHAERVCGTALALLDQVRASWDLDDETMAHDLEWGARLHEIGLAIAHSGYHKHGAYVVEFADMAGFSRSDQTIVAALVRGHRRKFARPELAALPEGTAPRIKRLCVLLRLAVLLHRGRSPTPPPEVRLNAAGSKLQLEFPRGWLDEHPMTQADLAAEAEYLRAGSVTLSFG